MRSWIVGVGLAFVGCTSADKMEEPGPPCAPVTVYADQDGDGVGAGAAFEACVDDPTQLPSGMAAAGGDCNDQLATVTQPITGFADSDGDHVTAGPAVELCAAVLPAGYRATASPEDCDDQDATISQPSTFYVDSDGDQYGASSGATSLCKAQPPQGYALDGSDPDDTNASITPVDVDGDHVSDANDCAPADASTWRTVTLYVDSDNDAYSTGVSQQACIGTSPPAGFALGSAGLDCNDNDATLNDPIRAYADMDADGAGGGPLVYLCVATLPSGYTLSPTDCDDSNPNLQATIFGYRDADGDGYGVDQGSMTFCAATLPSGYSSKWFDNDDNDPAVTMREVRIAVYQGGNLTCGTSCRGQVVVDLAAGGDFVSLTLSAHDFTDWIGQGARQRVGRIRVVGYDAFTLAGPFYTDEVTTCSYRYGCGNGMISYDVYAQGYFAVP